MKKMELYEGTKKELIDFFRNTMGIKKAEARYELNENSKNVLLDMGADNTIEIQLEMHEDAMKIWKNVRGIMPTGMVFFMTCNGKKTDDPENPFEVMMEPTRHYIRIVDRQREAIEFLKKQEELKAKDPEKVKTGETVDVKAEK